MTTGYLTIGGKLFKDAVIYSTHCMKARPKSGRWTDRFARWHSGWLLHAGGYTYMLCAWMAAQHPCLLCHLRFFLILDLQGDRSRGSLSEQCIMPPDAWKLCKLEIMMRLECLQKSSEGIAIACLKKCMPSCICVG